MLLEEEDSFYICTSTQLLSTSFTFHFTLVNIIEFPRTQTHQRKKSHEKQIFPLSTIFINI